MAKFSDKIKLKHLPSSIEGVYARNMSHTALKDKMEELQKVVADKDKGMENMTVFVFKEFACDENGELFEDCLTIEGIEACIDMPTILQLITELPNLYVPKENSLGNLKETLEDSSEST